MVKQNISHEFRLKKVIKHKVAFLKEKLKMN